MKLKNIKWMGLIAIVFVVFAFVLTYFLGLFTQFNQSVDKVLRKQIVLNESVHVPDVSVHGGQEGWFPNKDAYNVPFVPKNGGEQVVVRGAVLTPYGAYVLSFPSALNWSTDAKLVFIKSLGTVELSGKSLGWQLEFGSKIKAKGYEIVIDGGAIRTQKETDFYGAGASVPLNFSLRDASWAIERLAKNPQWVNATMTGLNLTYNPDANAWDYIIAHSFGGSSVRVR